MTGNSSPRRDRDDRIQLRVFSGNSAGKEGDENALWPGITLGQFYERYVKPICHASARKRTHDAYDRSLNYWDRITGDPALQEIDEYVCAAFIAGLRQLDGCDGMLADNTVRKHCVHVQYCLDRAGPYSRRNNPLGKSLIADPPLLLKPAVVKNDVVDNFLLPEIGHWLEACHHASVPKLRRVSPKDWWQSLIIFDYNTGIRLETLLAARFDWITTDDEGTWLIVPSTALKGRKRGRRFFLNQAALEAIEAIRTDRDLIFEWRFTEGYLHDRRRELLAKTRIPEHRRFGFHALRKALATELGKINSIAAKMALGHAGGDVTIEHYQNRIILVESLMKLPQPVWRRDCAGQQLLMF